MNRVSGQGTTLISQYYSMTDNKPFIGSNYYRLKQVDFDGRSTNSKTIIFKIENEISVYPTFSDHLLNVQFASETNEAGAFKMYDEMGRIVKNIEFEPGTYSYQIQTGGLQSGRYFIRIKNGNNIEAHSFIKI